MEYRPSHRCKSSTFRITNLMHTMPVAIHLTTTRPSLFSLLPSNSSFSLSILPPLSSSSFSLSLISPSPPPPPPVSASLLVRSTLLPTGTASSTALLRLFSFPGPHLFRDASLPISLTGPHVLHSLLLSPPSETLDTSSLISKAASSCSPSHLSSLLLLAASGSRPHILSALISAGADVHCLAAPDAKPPLTLAVLSGCRDSVATLLSAGAKPNPDLIHAAAASGFADIVAVLASAGSGGNHVDSTGRSPLHAAAAGAHLEAARVCVSVLGSDPDLADSAGWTPLHCAASAGGPAELVEYLIGVSGFDARRALTRIGRKTAFELAVELGHEELFEALRPDDVGVMRGASGGDVSELRSRGSEGVDRRDQNGWTALHRAAFKGRTEAVTALVEMGASVDAVDDGGFTPLQRAVEAGHGDVAVWLVRNGAARAGIKGLKGMEKWEERGMLLDAATCTVGGDDRDDDVDKEKIRNSLYLENHQTRRGIEA